MAQRMTASIAGLMEGTIFDGERTASWRIASMVACSLSRWKGEEPVRSS